MRPNEKKYIFTDEVDYAKTRDASVWGTEDKATAKLLKTTVIAGKWFNLCAGDGRFNSRLLEKADEVIAVDIDESALKKLVLVTPEKLKKKLVVKKVNIAKKFPFQDEKFAGIFCVGTLHLFPKKVFRSIFKEMDRVLAPGGRIIIDFATDIRRTYPDGSLWIVENEPNYKNKEAVAFLKDVFKGYKIKIAIDEVDPEKVILGGKEYIFTSQFILLDALKR